MTRKDYIAIARVLNKYSSDLPDGLMFELNAMFRQDNNQFNAERFSNAVYNKDTECLSRAFSREIELDMDEDLWDDTYTNLQTIGGNKM